MEQTIYILLIEDNHADARLVDIYLNDCKLLKYDLKHITRLSDAITLKQNGYVPNLILLDMSLPDVSGIETVEKALSIFGSEIAIIVLTGLEDESMGLKTVQAGAQDYLEKDSLKAAILQRTILYAVERKRMQLEIEYTAAELRRSEAYLLQAQNIAKMGSYELIPDTRQMFWSEPVYGLLQSPKKIAANLDDYLACMPESDRSKVEAALYKNHLKVGQHFIVEHRIISADQLNTPYVVMQGEVVATPNCSKIIGTIQDVTDYKYAKELLLQSEERYRTIFEQSQDSIFIVSSEGRFIEFNKSIVQLLGYTAEELRYVNARDLYVDDSIWRLNENQLNVNNNIKDFELQLERKDGKVLDCLLNATLWYSIDGSVRGCHGIIRDITLQKRTQALIKAKEVAEQSAQMKEQFLANMSHEIRTPLNVVVGMAHLLENSELNNKQKEYLSALKLSSDNLLKLINNILDFSKIESGKLELEKHSFNLSDLIKELFQTHKFKAREKNINLFTQMDADIPELIVGDSVRIYQILNNLLSNAIKYTPQGEVLIKCERVAETGQYSSIKFSVRDTGIGIAPEKHKRIFETFVQAGEETTRLFGGTGLGLSIVRKLIEMHGSTIRLDSQTGNGATFSFTINFDKPNHSQGTTAINDAPSRITYKPSSISVYNDDNELPKDDEQQIMSDKHKNLMILLVEDHHLNQIVATDLLKKWSPDAQIDIAENGQEAIISLRKKHYDLVLMDISMPIMDGYEATEYIRKEMPKPICDIPIVAMTAHAFNKNAERCFEVGMNEFVSKPINPTILYSKLSRIVADLPSRHDRDTTHQYNPSTELPPAEIPEKRLINLQYLESLTGGDEDIKQIMLETLVRDLPNEVIQVENDTQRQDWNALKASAHKLKSTCAYMGLDQSTEIARTIEHYAWDKTNLDDIPPLVQQLAHTCRLAHRELQQELQGVLIDL